jgi:cysteine synthase B
MSAPMSILDRVGETPMVALATGLPANDPRSAAIRLFGKLEGNNPAGSVKDRPAKFMILGAEARGEIGPGSRLVEPTSGNTGIALAMIATARGYSISLVMPETATAERVKLMRAYGADVVLTPGAGSMEAAIDRAREMVAREGFVMLDQFGNPDNWRAHHETTGPEIWRDTAGQVTHFVSAMGTTGTIMGVSRALRERAAAAGTKVSIVGCRPTEGSCIPGIRRWPEAYLPKIYDATWVDEFIDVDQRVAEDEARRLGRREGVLVGMSAAGAVWAARRICQRLFDEGRAGTVVCILCDRGDRYLSSTLFG